jgi:hypothetical protein
VPETLLNSPAYTGMKLYPDNRGGYAVWLPKDWFQIKLKRNHHGMLFSPYKDDINTSLLVEKHILKYSVTKEDIDILREGFHQGMMALPGVEVESTEESLSETINIFDARFSFLEGEIRRKRWVRNLYWGNGQLVLIAQGRTVEDFEYWLPMFFNTMVTTQIL